MGNRQVEQYCCLGEEEESLLQRAFQERHLSARGYQKILKVARTIADLAFSNEIAPEHILEAASYRSAESEF